MCIVDASIGIFEQGTVKQDTIYTILQKTKTVYHLPKCTPVALFNMESDTYIILSFVTLLRNTVVCYVWFQTTVTVRDEKQLTDVNFFSVQVSAT